MATDRNTAAAAGTTPSKGPRTPSATPTDDELARQLLEPDGPTDGDDAEADPRSAPREAGEADPSDPDDTEGDPQDAEADEAGDKDSAPLEIDADALIEANPEIPVTVEGETKNVPLKELLSGYQRQAVFTQGTQQLAKDRELVSGEAQRLLQQESFLMQRLAPLVQQLTEELGAAPPESLIDENPEEYARQKARFDSRKGKVDKAIGLMDETLGQQRALQQQRHDQWVQGERAKVRTMFPETADPAKAPKLQTEIVEYLSAKGFDRKEISELTDSRMFSVLMDGLAGHRARKSIPNAKSKTKRLPIVRTSARPGKGEASAVRETGLMRLAKGSDKRTREAALTKLISGE